MSLPALAVTLLLHQTPLEQSQLSIGAMRDKLRAIEHGLQEASDLGDNNAFECVKNGQLAIAHQVESAEQWDAMLKDAVANEDLELTERLLQRILDAEREVTKRSSELSACKLKVDAPEPPVINRTWFFCSDAPAHAANPTWRGCERRRGSAVTFGLEALLVAAPIGTLAAMAADNFDFGPFGGFAVESAVGGLAGGLALFILAGGIALAVTGGLNEDTLSRVGPAVGICTGLGVGAGQVIAMWVARPDSGNAAPIAASVTYLVLATLSALLVAVHDHFSVAAYGDDDSSIGEKSFAFAPVLMAVSSIVTVPAVWTAYARR